VARTIGCIAVPQSPTIGYAFYLVASLLMPRPVELAFAHCPLISRFK